MIVGRKLKGFNWSKGEKKKYLPTNKLSSVFFPCIVLNVKYLWVCDNVMVFTVVVAYCGGVPLQFFMG